LTKLLPGFSPYKLANGSYRTWPSHLQ